MNVAQRQVVLHRWVMPSSENEKDKQDRALRMVKGAVDAWPAFQSVSYRVYAKGSYANNTNVRLDSDVDIAVQNCECLYYEYFGCEKAPGTVTSPYDGIWTPARWRAEILAALKSRFPGEVSASGTVAITIDEHDGTRPDVDVVPSFDFVRYDSSDMTRRHKGSKVFPTSGTPIVNYPDQQLEHGTAKNVRTNGRYKRFVRALKSAENQMVADGTIDNLPSYFMECLVWNVPDRTLTAGADLSAGFQSVLVWLWDRLKEENYNQGGLGRAQWPEVPVSWWGQVESGGRAPAGACRLEVPGLLMVRERARLVRIAGVGVSAAWSLVFVLSGVPLEGSAQRLLAYTPSVLVLLTVGFDLWVWKWPGVHQLVGRPRIDGTWKATIRPHEKSRIPKNGNRGPIASAVVVEQTFWTLTVRLLTAESSSMSEVASMRAHGESREQHLLTYTYRNEPKVEHRPRSSPHRGACELTVVGRVPEALSGTYWTDRLTVGDMELVLVDRRKDRQSLADLPSVS